MSAQPNNDQVKDLKADDFAKLFGSEENFKMLKGLLNHATQNRSSAPVCATQNNAKVETN